MDKVWRAGVMEGMRETLDFLRSEGLLGDLGWGFDKQGRNQKKKLENHLSRFIKREEKKD